MEKQGELLKKFKESDEFFSHVGLSQSNIYFRIGLYIFLCKFTILKKSLTSSCFKSNSKLIKKVCKPMNIYFMKKKINKNVSSFFILVSITLSSLENFIHGEFYLVWRLLSSIENFIQHSEFEEFHLVQRLLSSIGTFI